MAETIRIQVTVDKAMWRKMKKLRAELRLPNNLYSQVVNQSLHTFGTMLESAKKLKGKSEVERNVEFYNMMSQIMSDQAQHMLKL